VSKSTTISDARRTFPGLIVGDAGSARADVASLLRSSGYLVAEEAVAVKAPLRNVIARAYEPVIILLDRPQPRRSVKRPDGER
jgi:hypothetical protein